MRGRDALDLLHRLSTNDLREIPPGRVVQTVLTTEKGRIVDAVYVLPAPSGYLLLTSIGAEEEIVRWIGKFTIMEEIELEVVTRTTAQLTLIGPDAQGALAGIQSRTAGPIPRTAVVTSGGLTLTHLIVPSGEAPGFLEAMLRTGGITMGMQAWEILRIMHGIPERPFELRADFNPYDVALRDAISYTKGCYIGQEVIARLDTYQKVRRLLVGLRSEAGPVAVGSTLLGSGGEEAGLVTSQAPAPFEGQWLGLAVARGDRVEAGKEAAARGSAGKIFIETFPIRIPSRA